MSDEDLMVAVAEGSEDALATLVERHGAALAGFLWRQTGGRDVEDLAQETWIRVVRSASRFDPARRFTTWLFQIAVNLARDWHRRRPPDPVIADEAATVPAAGSARIDAERLLERLSPEHREVLVLRTFHDLSERDASEILGVPEGTVKSRFHNALRKLASLVEGDET